MASGLAGKRFRTINAHHVRGSGRNVELSPTELFPCHPYGIPEQPTVFVLFFGCNNPTVSQIAYFSYIVRRVITSRSNGNTLPVTMILEIMNYYGGCHGINGKYLCLAILINNEECRRSTTCLGQTCLSKPQCKMQIP